MRGIGKKRICDAFCSLGMSRPISDITVSDLITVAGVNRSTFYYHYDGLQDVLESMMTDFCRQYLHLLAIPPDQMAHTIDPASHREMEEKICRYIVDVEERVRFFLSEPVYYQFRQRFYDCAREYVRQHRVVQIYPDGRRESMRQGIVYDYFIYTTCMELFSYLEFWARRDFSEGAEDFIRIFNELHAATITLMGTEAGGSALMKAR